MVIIIEVVVHQMIIPLLIRQQKRKQFKQWILKEIDQNISKKTIQKLVPDLFSALPSLSSFTSVTEPIPEYQFGFSDILSGIRDPILNTLFNPISHIPTPPISVASSPPISVASSPPISVASSPPISVN